MLSETYSSYLRTIQYNDRYYQTPSNTNRPPQGCLKICGRSYGVLWCLLGSNGVCYFLMLTGDVGRVSEEFFRGYLSAVYGRV